METVAVALHAMATRFEIVLHGRNPVALRAAGEEALAEIARLEAQLSPHLPSSEIARINALAARQPVKVTPSLFALLKRAKRLHQETGGAFDITVAPLVRCWGFFGGMGRQPEEWEIADAMSKSGMNLIQLNEQDSTIQFARPGVMLDLGAIGKGHAVERAAEILREDGITSAIIHGGTSTVFALGHPPDAETWKIGIEPPQKRAKSTPSLLATVPLKDETLSISAVWGRSFEAEGKIFGHVLNPRTGRPVTGSLLAAVALPSATEADALSTALLVLGDAFQERLASIYSRIRTLLVLESEQDNGHKIESKGIAVHTAA